MFRSCRLLALALPLALACGGCGGADGTGGAHASPLLLAMRADLDVDDHNELYVVDAEANLRKVSGATGVGYGVRTFAWSPDRTRIAFLDDKIMVDQYDVYVVDPASGADPVRVSGPHVLGFDLSSVEWSPDGSRLLLLGSLDLFTQDVLACVPAAGGSVEELTLPGDHPLYAGWSWSPDSTRVAFQAGTSPGATQHFFVAQADGSVTVDVSGPLVPGGSVRTPQYTQAWSASGARVAFRADKQTLDVLEAYTVNSDGTGLLKVSHALAVSEDVYVLAWSPVANRLAYQSTLSNSPYYARLYTVNGSGGVAVPVSEPSKHAQHPRWRPDGTVLAYVETQALDELRLADPLGGPSTPLATLAGTDTVIASDLAWSPDGTRIAYRAGIPDAADDDHYRLFSVAVGGAPLLVSTSVVADDGLVAEYFWSWAPDSQRLLFRAQVIEGGPRAVYVGSAVAGGDALVSLPGVNVGFNDCRWTSDGAHVVWQEGNLPGTHKLFASTGGAPLPIVASVPATAEILWFQTK